MNRYLVMLFSAGGFFFLAACASDLSPADPGDRGPAPYSPDPTQYLPTPPPSSIGGQPRI